MKKLVVLAMVIAVVGFGLAVICRIKLAPIAGMPAKAYLSGAQTALLFAIALLLMDKK